MTTGGQVRHVRHSRPTRRSRNPCSPMGTGEAQSGTFPSDYTLLLVTGPGVVAGFWECGEFTERRHAARDGHSSASGCDEMLHVLRSGKTPDLSAPLFRAGSYVTACTSSLWFRDGGFPVNEHATPCRCRGSEDSLPEGPLARASLCPHTGTAVRLAYSCLTRHGHEFDAVRHP